MINLAVKGSRGREQFAKIISVKKKNIYYPSTSRLELKVDKTFKGLIFQTSIQFLTL